MRCLFLDAGSTCFYQCYLVTFKRPVRLAIQVRE
jgi:hypothetical protein